MKNLIRRFAKCESGATAIEYSLLAALISVAIIATAGPVGDAINAVFTNVETELTTAATP